MLSEDQIDAYIDTVLTVAHSPYVESFIIGFTSQSLRARFAPYRTNEYEYIVAICDRLNRDEALKIEEKIFQAVLAGKDGGQDEILFKKYNEKRRQGPYRRSYGGRGVQTALLHTVYMAWWAPNET